MSPLPPLSASLPAHAGADNEGVHRGISASAKAQRGAGSCERSTHAEVTHFVVTRRAAGLSSTEGTVVRVKTGAVPLAMGPGDGPATAPRLGFVSAEWRLNK